MYIKELQNFIPKTGFYNSTKWFNLVVGNIERITKEYFGERELFYDNENNVNEYVKNSIDIMFCANSFNYEKIADAITAEYNPVWNVESKETLEYDRDNTGTQTNDTDNKGTQSYSGTNTGTQGVSGSNTGTQGVSGSNTGTETNADGVTITRQDANTTYDSDTDFDTTKQTETHSGNVTRTDNLAHTETRTDNLAHSETRTDNLAHSETRTDNLTQEQTREDDLHEHYFETKIRGGNIGVTESSQLAQNEILFRLRFNLQMIISKDIADFISYNC